MYSFFSKNLELIFERHLDSLSFCLVRVATIFLLCLQLYLEHFFLCDHKLRTSTFVSTYLYCTYFTIVVMTIRWKNRPLTRPNKKRWNFTDFLSLKVTEVWDFFYCCTIERLYNRIKADALAFRVLCATINILELYLLMIFFFKSTGMLKSLGIKDSELGDVKFFLEKLVNTGFLD